MSGEPRDITGFLYEIGLLKRYPRTGWLLAGVPSPESVADHSFRTSVTATVIAVMEGADPQRASFLAIWHDSQETRTTDLPHLTKRYVTAATNEQVTSEQTHSLPPAIADMIRGAVTEYETGETLEARCARDADKLECLLQAREYEDQGHHNVQPWIDSSIASLQTPAAKQLAGAALALNTLDWLPSAQRTVAQRPR
jgi:putative hydrolase of HD superfamily